MRKFSFNNFKKNNSYINEPAKVEKPRFSAYRTIISKHEAVNQRLQDEPRAVIDSRD